jgi:hypothetical protein
MAVDEETGKGCEFKREAMEKRETFHTPFP